eukprot:scaffold20591_cov132-Isochrysis_galbana.AAC.1
MSMTVSFGAEAEGAARACARQRAGAPCEPNNSYVRITLDFPSSGLWMEELLFMRSDKKRPTVA